MRQPIVGFSVTTEKPIPIAIIAESILIEVYSIEL